MIKSHRIEKLIEEEVVDDIICNKCGKSCKGGYNFEGLLEIKIMGGYGSLLGDMETYEFSICETCLQSMFEKFLIPPEHKDFSPGGHHDLMDYGIEEDLEEPEL